ncbi:MAG: hypothetical protein GKR90_11150 [Pseudomonadales bacterium]|nr:hypothetical protein [Pseudomonadales bacterium]
MQASNRLISQASRSLPNSQQGVVAIMVVFAMLAILGMAGLALDGGNTMVNKTRLQNIADASALSAAKTLLESNYDTVAAEVEARAMFLDNTGDAGNTEISNAYQAGDITVAVEFSSTLLPFVPGTIPAQYVRVTATGLSIDSYLLPVGNVTELQVIASAVSGPSTALGAACNVAPMMVCAGEEEGDGPANNYGFNPGEVTVLKAGSPGQAMQKGNFQLIRLDDSQGGSDIREAFAGEYGGCLTISNDIETEPGNTVGPVAQGLNTRLGVYSGPMRQGGVTQYPPDEHIDQPGDRFTYVEETPDNWVVYYNGHPVDYLPAHTWAPGTLPIHNYMEPVENVPAADQPLYTYKDYVTDTSPTSPSIGSPGVPGRRVMAMPMGFCGDEAGQSTIELATMLCFYILQDVDQGPDPDVFGQFTGDICHTQGTAGPVPDDTSSTYLIQLYKDPARVES